MRAPTKDASSQLKKCFIHITWILALLCFAQTTNATHNEDALYCRFQEKLEVGANNAFSSQFEAAISTLLPMLDSFPQNPALRFERMMGEYHYFLGMVNYYLGAPEYCRHHLKIADSLVFAIDGKGTELRARIRREQGIVAYFYDENPYEARDLYEASLVEWYAAPKRDSFSIALTLQYAGQAANRIGEYDKALNFYRHSLDIREALFGRMHSRVGIGYMNVGNVYYRMNANDEAKRNYELALEILQKTAPHKKKNLEWTMSNLALVYDALGDFDASIRLHRQAIALIKSMQQQDQSSLIISYANLAETYIHLNDLQAATREISNAQRLADKMEMTYGRTVATIESVFAHLYYQQNETSAALDALQRTMQALSTSEEDLGNWKRYPSEWTTNEPEAMMEIALFKSRMLRDMAESSADSLLQLEVSIRGYQLVMNLGQRLSLDYQNRNDILQLKGFGKDFEWEALDCAFRLQQEQHNPQFMQLAFEFSEQAKYRMLLANFRESNRMRNNQNNNAAWQELEALRRQCAELDYIISSPKTNAALIPQFRDRLLARRLEMDEKEDLLMKASPEYVAFKKSSSSIPISEVKAQLKDAHSALIEYTLSDSLLFVLCFSKDTVHLRKTVLASGFADSLEMYINLNKVPDADQNAVHHYAQLSHFLYKTLIEPEKNLLGEAIQDWTIIPDGILTNIPFETLTSQAIDPEVRSFSKLAYMIRDYNFHYAASVALLLEQNKRLESKIPSTCLGMAWGTPEKQPPTASNMPLRKLPGSNQEIEMLQQKVQGHFLQNNAASESAFKAIAPKHDILHLALHAQASDGDPKIYFPSGGIVEEDGILHFHELFQLRLKARMAVLSACETGSGKLDDGEGIHNMASGFAAAGVATVLMTLWELDDHAGNEIIQHFYEQLLEQQRPDVALRAAKLSYLKNAKGPAASPFFWASIVPSGNMRPLPSIHKTKTTNTLLWSSLFFSIFILAAFGIYSKIKTRKQ